MVAGIERKEPDTLNPRNPNPRSVGGFIGLIEVNVLIRLIDL